MDQAARWAAGAEGERRVAAALATLPAGWTVAHDRLLRPGRSEANLDHIVVGPTGVYLVDAKNRAGRVTEHEGGLFQHRWRDGRTETLSLAAELTKVHGMAAYMAAETDRPVTPVLCLAGDRSQDFGEPRMVRGVWVVPVAALPGWMRARPVLFSSEVLPTVATRVITDFPSTTTEPALLEAMAAAALPGRRQGRRTPRNARSVAPARRARPARSARAGRPGRFVRRVSGLAMMALMFAAFALLLAKLPTLLTAGVEHLAASGAPAVTGTAGTAQGPTSPSSPTRKSPAMTTSGGPGATRAMTTKVKTAPSETLRPPDCANASAAEVKAIIRRTVKPVVTSSGCAWGTRLDDQSTVLVTITMAPRHDSWDTNLVTSVKQRRVVFGGALDTSYRPATKASVASGQVIVRGTKPVRARADTVVVVSTHKLGVSDDRAREMAVAIAAAANGGG